MVVTISSICRSSFLLPRRYSPVEFIAWASTRTANDSRPSPRKVSPRSIPEFRKFRPVKPQAENFIFHERMKKEMAKHQFAAQQFDSLLILDFEATCDNTNDERFRDAQEIIEFPVIRVDTKSMEAISTFHRYVQPRNNPQLTPFCTKLTGIIQDMVDGQPEFAEVIRLFDEWMRNEGLLEPGAKFAFVTCGDWDLNVMLPKQSNYNHMTLPSYFDSWINIKHSFAEVIGHYPRGLMLMLESLSIPHLGRHHSGIDDCKNILQIVRALAERGHVFHTTGRKSQPRSTKTKPK